MALNPNLTQQDAIWLKDEYSKVIDKRIDHSTINTHLKAFNLMKNSNESVPSCKCQWRGAAQVTQGMYDQYKYEIEVLANGVTKSKRGRKKSS